MTEERIHWRKAFNSPYLSSADIVNPMVFTISHVNLEADKTNRTKEFHNTAYFAEPEIRPGEKMKPMILNVTNCKVMQELTGSKVIDDWKDIKVTIYVEQGVKFGRDVTEGLRISSRPVTVLRPLTPDMETPWHNAKKYYAESKNLERVLARFTLTDEHHALLIAQARQEYKMEDEATE